MKNEDLVTNMLMQYSAVCDAKLQAIPNGMVIVMSDDVRENLVKTIIDAFHDGVIWAVENYETIKD